jgi:hypothetical protein
VDISSGRYILYILLHTDNNRNFYLFDSLFNSGIVGMEKNGNYEMETIHNWFGDRVWCNFSRLKFSSHFMGVLLK